MSSLLELSSRRDQIVDLADWVEISAFLRADKSISKEDLVRSLVREGGDRFEQKARDKATEAFDELETRGSAIGNAIANSPVASYPYEIDGDLLKLVCDPFGADHAGLLYVFLLAITRASMDSRKRRFNNIDPTQVFEDICAETLCQFWGGRSGLSDVFVTGTSNKVVPPGNKRFPSLINLLTKQLCDGGGWRRGAKSPGAGDGGLDLAVWRRFHDKRPGALVGFAQCKTGDHWRDHLGRRNPTSICGAYLIKPLILAPIPVYMVPCRVSLDEWENVMQQHSGMLFDRCRITTFGTQLPIQVITNCQSWLTAVMDKERQRLVAKGIITAPALAGATP
jgi:hypothetical protein